MTKTKLIRILTVCAMLTSIASLPAHAAIEGNPCYYMSEEGSGFFYVGDCDTEATGEVYIYRELFGDPVTAISVGAFNFCDKITAVWIPDSVINIGAFPGNYHFGEVFMECTALTDIYYTGTEEQWNAISFTENAIPEGVTIHFEAEDVPESPATCRVRDYVAIYTYFKDGDFFEVTDCIDSEETAAVTELVINDMLFDAPTTAISAYAFEDCTNLTSVTIPASVTSIGTVAFGSCTALTDIYFTGTQSEWNAIAFGENAIPDDVEIHYTKSIGDVNGDGNIDATDAAAILLAAAAEGSGQNTELSKMQQYAADVNTDGELNALDAALVLQYAAYAGAGGTLTFEEFLKTA